MAVNVLKPHTRVDNSIIDDLTPKIGLAGLGVLVIIKRYLNQKTGQCNPSYKTIARKAGVDRSTIIRYVKKLKAFNLLDPELQFKEDGSPTSNQYNFPSPGAQPANWHEQDKQDKGGAALPPPPPHDCQYPSGSDATSPSAALPPKQSSLPNKKQRTIEEVDLMPTERQKTCPHPPSEIVFLTDNVTICNHCYGLLDDNLTLIDKENPVENVQAA
jgi:Helix-turn-helix domain